MRPTTVFVISNFGSLGVAVLSFLAILPFNFGYCANIRKESRLAAFIFLLLGIVVGVTMLFLWMLLVAETARFYVAELDSPFVPWICYVWVTFVPAVCYYKYEQTTPRVPGADDLAKSSAVIPRWVFALSIIALVVAPLVAAYVGNPFTGHVI